MRWIVGSLIFASILLATIVLFSSPTVAVSTVASHPTSTPELVASIPWPQQSLEVGIKEKGLIGQTYQLDGTILPKPFVFSSEDDVLSCGEQKFQLSDWNGSMKIGLPTGQNNLTGKVYELTTSLCHFAVGITNNGGWGMFIFPPP